MRKKGNARVLHFPRVPVAKPGRAHRTNKDTLPRKAKHKKAPDIDAFVSAERCMECGTPLEIAGIDADGCTLCAPFLYSSMMRLK